MLKRCNILSFTTTAKRYLQIFAVIIPLFIGVLTPIHIDIKKISLTESRAEAAITLSATSKTTDTGGGKAKVEVVLKTTDLKKVDFINGNVGVFKVGLYTNQPKTIEFGDSAISENKFEQADPNGNDKNQTFVNTFTNLDINKAYKIQAFLRMSDGSIIRSETLSIVPNAGDVGAETDIVTGNVDPQKKEEIPSCFTLTNFRVEACIAQLVYYALYQPTQFLATLSGKFLDYFILYSIDSNSYGGTDGGFVSEGWKVSRDLANIAFIFILLWVAIQTILGMGGSSTKQTVGTIIVIAVMINFSLFFTKVVIDAGNITARVFYNAIEVVEPTQQANPDLDVKSITSALVAQFNPQKIISATNSDATDANINSGVYLLVTIVAVLLNLFMIYMFLSVAFVFVARVIGLWLSMIFSPIAFVSQVVPGLKSQKRIGWTNWLSNLTQLTLMAPTFLFFLYLIIKFASVKRLVDVGADAGVLDTIISVAVPFAIIFGLLMAAKSQAIEMSGEIGKMVNEYAGKATGLAVGAMAGGAAVLGRNQIGKRAEDMLSSDRAEKLRQDATGTGAKAWLARQELKTYSNLSKGSFDARKSAVGEAVSKQSGINFDDKKLSYLNLDTKRSAGGYEAQTKRTEKELKENAEFLKSKKDDTNLIEAYDKKYKEALKKAREENRSLTEDQFKTDHEKKFGERPIYKTDTHRYTTKKHTQWQKEYDEALEKEKALKGTVDEKAFKKDYEGRVKKEPKIYETAKDANKARREEYKTNLQNGTWFSTLPESLPGNRGRAGAVGASMGMGATVGGVTTGTVAGAATAGVFSTIPAVAITGDAITGMAASRRKAELGAAKALGDDEKKEEKANAKKARQEIQSDRYEKELKKINGTLERAAKLYNEKIKPKDADDKKKDDLDSDDVRQIKTKLTEIVNELKTQKERPGITPDELNTLETELAQKSDDLERMSEQKPILDKQLDLMEKLNRVTPDEKKEEKKEEGKGDEKKEEKK